MIREQTKKRFIVRKYVMASSVMEAIRKERKEKVHDVFIDELWFKENPIKGFK